ncbi:MAG: hypothetical protein ACREMQ_23815 [Longimicrobiales bacterium]
MMQISRSFSTRRIRSGCFFAFLLLAVGSVTPVHGQVRDTTAVRRDTTVAEPDSALPPPQFVQLSGQWTARRSAGTWYWNRLDLAASGAVTLLELLNNVPGIVTLRTGMFLQPEVASAFGGTAPRLEVELDGYVLDPLAGSALDLSEIGLVELSEVLVERHLDVLRIRLRSAAAEDARVYSRVEASIGEPTANLFRGIFLAPRLLVGPLGFAIERMDTDGSEGREPADSFNGWLKWGWLRASGGIQLELRRTRLDREPRSPWPETRKRDDIIMRGRARLAQSFAVEGYVGRSTIDLEPIDTVPGLPDSLRAKSLERESAQGGVSARLSLPGVWLEGAVRRRHLEQLPGLQTELGAGIGRTGIGAVDGRLSYATWRNAPSTLALSVRGEAGPFLGLRPFAEWTTGERGAPLYNDTLGLGVLTDDRSGYRLGAEGSFKGFFASAALVHLQTDSVPAFRLPFDSAAVRFPGGSVTGWELYGRIPLYKEWLAATGSYLQWTSGTRWIYMPARMGRGALELRASPLASGNLEFIGRLEGLYRSAMPVPDPNDPTTLTTVPARTLLNGYLQIRIIDVRIFIRSDDMTGANAEDLLGRVIRGPRLIYGVQWQFWN